MRRVGGVILNGLVDINGSVAIAVDGEEEEEKTRLSGQEISASSEYMRRDLGMQRDDLERTLFSIISVLPSS